MEKLYDRRAVQALSFTLLMMALFLLDIFKACLAPDKHNDGLYGTLLAIFIFFVFEIIVCCACKHNYFAWHPMRGFFFYMDVIGTMSLILDIPWLSPWDFEEDSSLLRASRTSRVGARAARVTKLVRVLRVVRVVRVVKMLKFFRPFGARQDANEALPPASQTSRLLSESTSKRVAMLCMLFVLCMPLLQYEALSVVPQRAHLEMFERRVTLSTPLALTEAEVRHFFQFYEHADARPWRLSLPNTTWYVQNANRQGSWDSNSLLVDTTTGRTASAPGRLFDRSEGNFEMRGGSCGDVAKCVTIDVNEEDRIVNEAVLSIALILCVIVLLVSFSMNMQGTIEKIVVRPIERIFGALEAGVSELLAAAKSQVTGSNRGDDDEMTVLEAAVSKLSNISQTVTTGKSIAARNMLEATNVDGGTKDWLERNFTEGLRQRRRSVAVPMSDAIQRRKTSVSSAMTSTPLHSALLKSVTTLEFDALDCKAQHLPAVASYVFAQAGCIADFRLATNVVNSFLQVVLERYNDNPYHNASHAVDVMQSVLMMIRLTEATDIISPVDIFAVLVASIGHDIAHPGVNQQFLVQTRHELAMTYNDKSVLENMHCAELYAVMKQPHCDIFGSLTSSDWVDARKTVVSSVLATDMVHHFKMVSDVENFCELHHATLEDPQLTKELFESEKNTQFLLSLFIHASDIGNPCAPWDICEKWSHRVMDEFFAQGDQERDRGMEVSAMFDRHKVNKPQMQVNFIEFIVAPLYGALVKLCPSLNKLGQQLVMNRQTWGTQYVETVEGEDERLEETGKENSRFAAFREKYTLFFDEADEDDDDDEGQQLEICSARD